MAFEYGVICEKLEEKVEAGNMTLEQADEVETLAYEKYCEEMDKDVVVTEATAKFSDYLEGMKGTAKIYKDHVREIKKAIKKKEFVKAKIEVAAAKKAIHDAEAKTNKLDDSVPGDVINVIARIYDASEILTDIGFIAGGAAAAIGSNVLGNMAKEEGEAKAGKNIKKLGGAAGIGLAVLGAADLAFVVAKNKELHKVASKNDTMDEGKKHILAILDIELKRVDKLDKAIDKIKSKK